MPTPSLSDVINKQLLIDTLRAVSKKRSELWLKSKNPERKRASLADRTNGRAIGTVLRLSVCRLSVCDVMYCG